MCLLICVFVGPAALADTPIDTGCESPLYTSDLGYTGSVNAAAGFPFLIVASAATLTTRNQRLEGVSSFNMGATSAQAAGPVLLKDGSWGLLAPEISSGEAHSVQFDLITGEPSTRWVESLIIAGCTGEASATPEIHLLSHASTAFQAEFQADLAYFGSVLDSTCTGYRIKNVITAFDASNGSVTWAFNSNAGYDLDGVYGLRLDVGRDLLFATSERQNAVSQDSVWAIDVLTGSLAWSTNAGRLQTRAAQSSNRLYVANMNGNLIALDKDTGEIAWTSTSVAVPFLVDPVRVEGAGLDNSIFVLDYLGRVHRAEDNGASVSWTWDTQLPLPNGSFLPQAALAVDPATASVFASSNDGTIHVLNISDGAIRSFRSITEDNTTITTMQFLPPEVLRSALIVGTSSNGAGDSGAAIFCTTDLQFQDGFE